MCIHINTHGMLRRYVIYTLYILCIYIFRYIYIYIVLWSHLNGWDGKETIGGRSSTENKQCTRSDIVGHIVQLWIYCYVNSYSYALPLWRHKQSCFQVKLNTETTEKSQPSLWLQNGRSRRGGGGWWDVMEVSTLLINIRRWRLDRSTALYIYCTKLKIVNYWLYSPTHKTKLIFK